MKTVKEIAQALDGQEYSTEFPPDYVVKWAKEAGIVICYGASDDLFEVDGAIRDETGAPGIVCFDRDDPGLLQPECDDERCPHEIRRQKQAPKVRAKWCENPDKDWTFETLIPHEKFRVIEDNHVFCEGIVFSVEDMRKAPVCFKR